MARQGEAIALRDPGVFLFVPPRAAASAGQPAATCQDYNPRCSLLLYNARVCRACIYVYACTVCERVHTHNRTRVRTQCAFV